MSADTKCSAPASFPHKVTLGLEPAHELTVLDLSRNLVREWIGSSLNERYLNFMRRYYGWLAIAFRIAAIVFWLVFFVPRCIGRWFAGFAFIVGFPVLICSISMMSVDMLLILIYQQEFIIFTIMNIWNWIMITIVFGDIRVLASIVGFSAMQVTILSDALFRTARTTYKSVILSIPLNVSIAAMLYQKKVDAPSENYATLTISTVRVEIVDVILNTSLTLLVLTLRILFRRRHMLSRVSEGIIRSSVYRAKLVSHPIDDQQQGNAETQQASSTQTNGLVTKHAKSECHSQEYSKTYDQAAPHLQPLQLIPLRVDRVSNTNMLCPDWAPSKPLTHAWQFAHVGSAVLGLLACGFSTFLPPESSFYGNNAQPWSQAARFACYATSVVALFASFGFTAFFVPCFQRELLRSLLLHFDVLFIMVQLVACNATLAAMMTFDYRCCALLAWVLWFLWLLMLDSVAPYARDLLRFKKHHAAPVLVLFLACGSYVVYSALFNPDTTLKDALMYSFSFQGSLKLEMYFSTV